MNKERWDEYIAASRENAHFLAEKIAGNFDQDVAELEEPVYRWLSEQTDENGQVFRRSERWYGWTLWDVRSKTDR